METQTAKYTFKQQAEFFVLIAIFIWAGVVGITAFGKDHIGFYAVTLAVFAFGAFCKKEILSALEKHLNPQSDEENKKVATTAIGAATIGAMLFVFLADKAILM